MKKRFPVSGRRWDIFGNILIRGFRPFPSSCPLRTSHFRYTSKFEMAGDLHAYSEIAGDMHAQTRLETGWVCTR